MSTQPTDQRQIMIDALEDAENALKAIIDAVDGSPDWLMNAHKKVSDALILCSGNVPGKPFFED